MLVAAHEALFDITCTPMTLLKIRNTKLIKDWMLQHFLWTNNEKTKAIAFGATEEILEVITVAVHSQPVSDIGLIPSIVPPASLLYLIIPCCAPWTSYIAPAQS